MALENPPIEISEGYIARHRLKVRGTAGASMSAIRSSTVLSARRRACASARRKSASLPRRSAMTGASPEARRGSRLATARRRRSTTRQTDARGDESDARRDVAARQVDRATSARRQVCRASDLANAARSENAGRAQGDLESDPAVMSAVAYAPASVSGMTAEERDHLVQTWSRTNFPEESARRLRLNKALDDARNVTVSGEKYFADIVRKVTASPVIESASRTQAAVAAVTATTAE